MGLLTLLSSVSRLCPLPSRDFFDLREKDLPVTMPKSRLGYPMILVLILMAACAQSYPLRVRPLTEEYYPFVSRRLREEGRVLLELHLGANWRSWQEPIIRQPAGVSRLDDWAPRLAKALHFEPWGGAKPNPKHAYLVTMIFCLDPPGDCKRMAPYPNSVPVIVRASPLSDPGYVIPEVR